MTILRKLMLLTLGLTVSACASVDVPTRNAPFESLPDGQVSTPLGYEIRQQTTQLWRPMRGAPVVTDVTPVVAVVSFGGAEFAARQVPVHVTSVQVRVPRELKVSEANRYLPHGDIVWREDPLGDRYAQVQTIVQAAMDRGVAGLDGPVPVVLDIEITKFHALTEKARYTTGGRHGIEFEMAVRHAETGALLLPLRSVRADLNAFGGQQALVAIASGQTQKVRITEHLAAVIRRELTKPEGYQNASAGFVQMLYNF